MQRYVRVIIEAFTVVTMVLSQLLVAGCSSVNKDFENAWSNAAHQPASSGDLQGRWQGVWASDVTGHTDQLRCIVTKKADGTCQARFHAKYHHVLSFGYTVPLKVQPAAPAGMCKFSGAADLGWLAGGEYHYEGEADGTNFFSIYRCKYDHGTFQMTRVGN